MANTESEQIRSDLSLELGSDQPLSKSKMLQLMQDTLGPDNCTIEKFKNKKILCYQHDEQREILLVASVTYMGGTGQHPKFKKRMQLKKWYKDVVVAYKDDANTNVRFIGVYHYQNNIIFVEVMKESYMRKKMNSSAAHIYTNDLFQAMKEGMFSRQDRNKNIIIAIKCIKFKEYLDGALKPLNDDLFEVFHKFNETFEFQSWLEAKKAIPEMYEARWNKWKETEWAGWFLEYKFDAFLKKHHLENKIKYIGSSNKKVGELDFDLYFGLDRFYGDLKASDTSKKEAPGNDQSNFLDCINKYDKFWYVIYEHNTCKDSETNNYEATRFRTNYIREKGEWPVNKKWNELSYFSRMKHSVKFVRMYIIELNRVNYREVLSEFNQGKQSNGAIRNPKFKINKRNIENFVVFQKEYIEIPNA